MKKTLLISGLLLALTASVASAGGINLGWNDCSATGAANQAFACNANSGGAPPVFQLFATFNPNATQQVAAFEFVIDIESAGATLPAWWEYKSGCRAASMTMNVSFSTGPFTCLDPWTTPVGLFDFSYIRPGVNGPNTARISGGGAVPATDPVTVEGGTEYYGFSLILNKAKTVGTGNCAGCLDPVCLVFNEMTLFNQVGAKTILTSPDIRNYATWQGGNIGDPAGCPLATPTSKATWGKIKSIYR